MRKARALLEVECMKKKAFLATMLCVTSLAGLFAPRESLACSGFCFEGAFLPATGSVPASLPGILWQPRIGGEGIPSASDVEIYDVTLGNKTLLAVDVQPFGTDGAFIIKPTAPLVPNADYSIFDKLGCDESSLFAEASFHTTDAVPLPTTLGTLIVVPSSETSLELQTVDGSCSTFIFATSHTVELVPSPEAEPFARAFHYETIVDGMPWHPLHSLIQRVPIGASWEGRGKDRLFIACPSIDEIPSDKPLSEGDHTVFFRATLPGSNVVLESETATVSLHCVPQPPVIEPPLVESSTCSAASARFGESSTFFATISPLFVFAAWRRRLARLARSACN